MKNYYLEKTIEELLEGLDTREEALECIENYFKERFTKEELFELLLRGQAHAGEDPSVMADYFNRM
ncbi:MAG: hypothetical protein IJZ79_03470 [Bacilli bacterium]|nr:hypothetical protein [Bacilli bacterium]MBQ8218788.1 hypothetical protein [Bacilli bacterium]